MTPVCIVAACRTPQGRFLGALRDFSATRLGVAAAHAAMARAGIPPDAIDLTIVGNVLSAGAGQNVARQIALGAQAPVASPAFTVNMMCASGLKAIALGAQAIQTGEAGIVLCGGTESMSNAPFVLERAGKGSPKPYKFGETEPVDTMLRDGLVDAFSGKHMADCMEDLARQLGINRQRQDAFALQSQQRTGQAAESLRHELIPMGELATDEHPRPGTTLEGLSALKPSFASGGTITAGNASGVNDGAAMVVLCSEQTARAKGWRPLARFLDCASSGCEPVLFGTGPVLATRKLCHKVGLNIDMFDTIEVNEAFAAQTLACIDGLGLDQAKVNRQGGAIALGHPIGASGARLVVHLAHLLARGESTRALATLCVGGGMGIAAALEACA